MRSSVAFRGRLSSTTLLAVHTCVRFYGIPANLPVPKKRKVWDSVDEAVGDVKSGDVLLCGGVFVVYIIFSLFKSNDGAGFGLGGVPGKIHT